MWTRHIFFNSKHLDLAFQSVIEFIQSSAPRFFQGLCVDSDGRESCAYCCIHNTLPSGAHAWTMEDPSRQWISWSMEAWHCHPVPWWASATVLPTDLHLFCRVPWKVSLLAEFFNKTYIFIYRILITSIQNLSKCPCPHCLIPLSRVHCLGMARDMLQRVTLACINNADRQGKVFAARRLIYKKNFLVTSSAIEAPLQDESWVPTSVSLISGSAKPH